MRAQVAAVLAPGGLGADALRAYEAGFGREMVGRLAKVAVIERVIGAVVLTVACVASVLPLTAPSWGAVAASGMVAILVLATVVSPRRIRLLGGSLELRPMMGWTVANQFLALSGLAVGLAATGVDASVWALAALASVGAFAAMLPISFNGYGVRELALALLGPQLGLDSKLVVASSLLASTALLGGLMAGGLAARALKVEREEPGNG